MAGATFSKMILFFIYIILFAYLIYFIWITEPLFEKNKIENKSYYPFISIVISAKNERNNIKPLLNSLSHQNYPKEKYEIIIANDQSTDNTLEQLLNYQSKMNNLKIIDIEKTPSNWGSKKWAINKCINDSKGEIILQTDADCLHGKNWIFEMAQPFQYYKIGFVCGPSYIGKKSNFWDLILKLESISQESFTYANSKKNLYISCTARNMAFRKTIFNEINGYNEISHIESGDDDLLLHKVATQTNCQIKYIANEKSLVRSDAPNTIKNLYLQRLRYASKGIIYYKLTTPKEVKIILPFLMIANFSAIIAMINFINYQSYFWLIPFLFKGLADIILINKYMDYIKINFKFLYFFILMIIHPFYIVIFGAIAPFTKIQWK